MNTSRFVTPDGITIEYFTETLTLRHVRYWRDYPNTDRCEAWLQRVDGVESRWYSLPLHLQGRAGHRFRLCWARNLAMESYELVGARNLATEAHRLSSSEGLVSSLFSPSHFGRWTFWLSLLAVMALALSSRSLTEELGWATLISVPPVAGAAGLCASLFRNRRDAGRTFDKVVEKLMTED